MTRTPRLPALFLALALMLSAAAVHARQMVSVARDEINMRSGAGTNHSVIWRLGSGYPLQVVERKGKWLKVRDFENDVGWVYRPLTAGKPHLIVKSKTANIRSGPGTRHKIVGRAEYGEVLRTLGHRSGWAKVRSPNGVVGWVARRLLWGW